jgi:signal transduction histidine kinase
MSHDTYTKLKTQWDKVKTYIEIADVAFISVRIIIFFGGIGWLVFSDLSQETFRNVSDTIIYFIIYSFIIYVWLFFSPQKKRTIYGFALFFDILFASMLVRVTGGFDSSFFIAFYLVTALYSFYYGLVPGAVIAAIAVVLYFLSCSYVHVQLHWTDFFLRISFLFLLSVPLGMLSQKLKRDKNEITTLNKDLKRYIQELQKVHGRLIQVEKLSELGRLAADVAHEIRNPLMSIGGFAKRLDNKLSQAKNEKECIRLVKQEKQYSEIIISEVERLEIILRDVLTFSKDVEYKTEYQEINIIVEESLKTFTEICKEQSIHIEEKLDASLPRILIDKGQIRQAVNNFISNAIDVMPHGGTIKIKTSMEELNAVNFVTLEVADTGHGIPEEELTMIFEPFYSSKDIGMGTGLGLSICKKIMDEHNGLIRVESELDIGTSFKLLFPYQSEEEGKKIKCWELIKCGVENIEGAAVIRCPSYPDYGRICWAVAGSFCGKKVTCFPSGANARKSGDCSKCEFYEGVVVRKDL